MRYNKFSFRSNIDINVTSSTELSLSLSNQYETKNRPYGSLSDLYAYMIRTSPIATPTIYSDGTLAKPSTGTNPYNSLNNSGTRRISSTMRNHLFRLHRISQKW